MSTDGAAMLTRRSLIIASLVAIWLLGCGRKPAETVVRKPHPVTPATLATLPGGATAAVAAAAAKENTSYLMRRRRDPPVIGGCEEACETPERAASYLFDGLVAGDRQALSRCFDWSILVVDGQAHGERWAGMWGRVDQHASRKAEIDRWLDEWLGWLEQIDEAGGLAHARLNGVIIKKLPGRTDVVEMTLRHPRLKKTRGAPIWRFEWTRRGWEWLITRIDHDPGRQRPGTPPAGSAGPGRL